MTLGGTEQVATAHCPNERTLDPQSAARQTHLCPSQPHYGLHPAMFSGNDSLVLVASVMYVCLRHVYVSVCLSVCLCLCALCFRCLCVEGQSGVGALLTKYSRVSTQKGIKLYTARRWYDATWHMTMISYQRCYHQLLLSMTYWLIVTTYSDNITIDFVITQW